MYTVVMNLFKKDKMKRYVKKMFLLCLSHKPFYPVWENKKILNKFKF